MSNGVIAFVKNCKRKIFAFLSHSKMCLNYFTNFFYLIMNIHCGKVISIWVFEFMSQFSCFSKYTLHLACLMFVWDMSHTKNKDNWKGKEK